MRGAIVVPTYDEAGTIKALFDPVVSRAADAPDARMDVLVMDDCSPKGTGEIVRCHPAFGEGMRLLTRATKDGLGGAFRAGSGTRSTPGYDVVVQMDAEGSHSTGEVPAMLADSRRNDVVIGSRYTTWRTDCAGLRVLEHPIIVTERAAGASKMSVGVALEATGRALRWPSSGP